MPTLMYLTDSIRHRVGSSERGATIVEYALVLAMISLVIVLAAAVVTGAVSTLWTTISTEFAGTT